MASTTTPLSLPSSSTSKPPSTRQPPSASSSSSSPLQCVTLPPPPVHHSRTRLHPSSNATAYCRRIARNVVALATGEAPAAVTATTSTTNAEVELPEIVKTVQQAWDKIEDKYAVASLGLAAVLALWASTGMISAIDRLPLVPGLLELIGIGYSGWFTYRNLIFKPEREALFKAVKDTYSEILGSRSS